MFQSPPLFQAKENPAMDSTDSTSTDSTIADSTSHVRAMHRSSGARLTSPNISHVSSAALSARLSKEFGFLGLTDKPYAPIRPDAISPRLRSVPPN